MTVANTRASGVLETSLGPLRYQEHGSGAFGPSVLFLQGLIVAPEVWSPVAARLTDRHRCITVDWPFGAHRQAMRADADLSPPGLARLVVEVLDLLGRESVVLVGNDSGGVISQLVVAANPERVSALVLVACDAFEVFPPGAYRILFELVAVPGVMRLVARGLSRPAIAGSRLGFGPVAASDPASLAAWAAPLAHDVAIRRDLIKLMRGCSNRQTLEAAQQFADFEPAVLVVWADDDRLFPRALGERLAGAFPNGHLATVPGSRTLIPHDQPRALAALISEFLDTASTE